MPLSTHDETSAAADRGRDASAFLPGEGGRNASETTIEAAEPIRRPYDAVRPFIGLVLIAALASGLFTWSVNKDSALESAAPADTLRAWLDDHPDDALVWQRLGDSYLVDATANDDLAAYLSATQALERSMALGATTIEANRSMAVASVGLHRFDDAETYASAVLHVRPDDRVALAALVDAQVELGHYAEAGVTADRLGELRPDAVSLSRLSYVSQLDGDLDAALDLMFAARTAAQGSAAEAARLSIFLAELHRVTGDRSLAAAFYQEATANASTLGRAKVGLAQLAGGDGDIAEAERLLGEPGIAASGLAALQTIARVTGASGDQEAAAIALGKVREIVDQSIAADIGIDPSEVLLEADFGTPERAATLAELVLEAQPDSIYAHHAAAWSAYVNGDLQRAIAHIDLALRTGLRDPVVLAHAALINDASDNGAAAASLLAEARAIDPGVIRAYDGLTPEMFSSIETPLVEPTP